MKFKIVVYIFVFLFLPLNCIAESKNPYSFNGVALGDEFSKVVDMVKQGGYDYSFDENEWLNIEDFKMGLFIVDVVFAKDVFENKFLRYEIKSNPTPQRMLQGSLSHFNAMLKKRFGQPQNCYDIDFENLPNDDSVISCKWDDGKYYVASGVRKSSYQEHYFFGQVVDMGLLQKNLDIYNQKVTETRNRAIESSESF